MSAWVVSGGSPWLTLQEMPCSRPLQQSCWLGSGLSRSLAAGSTGSCRWPPATRVPELQCALDVAWLISGGQACWMRFQGSNQQLLHENIETILSGCSLDCCRMGHSIICCHWSRTGQAWPCVEGSGDRCHLYAAPSDHQLTSRSWIFIFRSPNLSLSCLVESVW